MKKTSKYIKRKNFNKIFCFVFLPFVTLCLYLPPVAIDLISKRNNVNDRIPLKLLDKTRKKVLATDLKEIKTNVPQNEAIILTSKAPKFSLEIKNYKELFNVKINSDGNLLQVIQKNNGTYVVTALAKGTSYLTISADNSLNDLKIKCINGAFTKDDIIGATNDVIVTTNGVYKKYSYSITDPAIAKVYTDLPNPLSKEDIIATSDYLLVTKYGIFDTYDNTKILTSIYPTFSKDQLIAVSSDFLITKNGIFKYNGNQIAPTTFPSVEKKDIILVSGNILVTSNGIFDASSQQQILTTEFPHPTPSEILKIVYNSYQQYTPTISYLITTKGLFNNLGNKLESFSQHLPKSSNDLIATSNNFIVTTYGVYNIKNQNWLFENKNIQKDLIDVTDTGLITTFGIYNAFGNKCTKLYPTNVDQSDILQTTPYSIFTKKGIIFPSFENYNVYPVDLTSNDLMIKNSRGYWEGQTCITTKCIVTIYNGTMYAVTLPNDSASNPTKLCNNEIIYSDGSLIALTPYSVLSLTFNKTESGQLLMSINDIPNVKYSFPKPQAPTQKTKNYTSIIAGSASAIIIIIFGITWGIIAHKRNKAVNKRLDTLTTAIGSVFQKLIKDSKENKKPIMLEGAKKYNNFSNSKPTHKTFVPINNAKPPMKPIKE